MRTILRLLGRWAAINAVAAVVVLMAAGLLVWINPRLATTHELTSGYGALWAIAAMSAHRFIVGPILRELPCAGLEIIVCYSIAAALAATSTPAVARLPPGTPIKAARLLIRDCEAQPFVIGAVTAIAIVLDHRRRVPRYEEPLTK